MNRIKIQDIADALSISRVTVWKALNNKEGVSEGTRSKVLDYAAGTIHMSNPSITMNTLKPKSHDLVSIVVSRPETSSFWVTIIHQLAEEFSNHGIGLMYTFLPDECLDDYELPTNLSNGSLQGIIIINVYNKKMIHMLNELSIPKVFLDTVAELPTSNLNGDLILLEGKFCVREIVSHMIESGCKTIGFIGDIDYAKTNMERYEGYLLAMKEHNMDLITDICYVSNMTLQMYQEIIEDFVEHLPFIPDGFVCVNDHVATILLEYLESQGLNIPKDVLVSGYDDNNEFRYTKNLTTVHVENTLVAKRLANQLLYRMENTLDPYEITYIRPKVIYRNSTLRQDNKN